MRKMTWKFPDILLSPFHRNGKISARFRNINIAMFIIVSSLIVVVMLFVLKNITDTVSKDYARLYSANSVGILNTYFGREIGLVAKAARSKAVIDWFNNEDNQEKKFAAYEEMMGIIDLLSSDHLYIGIEKTLHEFTVEENFMAGDINSYATLNPDYFDDAWYFECAASDKDYLLNVDIDKILHRKRVWLNYKVTDDGAVQGVLCTGLEFSQLVEELFAEYDSKSVRGLVIDENGIIHMDSKLLGEDSFLYYSIEGERRVEDEFSDPDFLSAVNTYMESVDGYFDSESAISVIPLSTGEYHYATIAPIASTTWSVVTFYNSSSLFNMTKLLPLFVIIPFMFIIFIVATGFASTRLIFEPFENLITSITQIKSNMYEHVYGTDRDDEIGDLANTVQNMKDNLIDALGKVHYDALTGIHNRRFLEEDLSRIVKSMSRSGGTLSVMMIDVDYFKKYNDTYGHDVGDSCLRFIAAAIKNSMLRADDFVARYGGEEFAVVLPNTDENGARIIANRVLENVRACCVPHEKSDVSDHVTVSIGVTTGKVEYTHSGEDYIKRADEALYMSKQSGRDRYTFLDIKQRRPNDV